MTKGRSALTALAAVATALALAPAAASAKPAFTVVDGHANNPRQLSLSHDGKLYLGEAGKAGTLCFDPQTCAGFTGSVTKIEGSDHERIATRLISVGGKDGTFTVGPDGVSVSPSGNVYVIFTSAGPSLPPGVPARALRQLGNLVRVKPDGSLVKVADIDNFEFNHNPDGGAIDSDPYAVLAGRDFQIVADAAANAVYKVHDGHVSLLAVFPKNSAGAESVPTSLAWGPDGSVLVGELGGDSTPNRGSRVWQIWPGKGEQAPHLFARGFTAITGLAWRHGTLYVCELTTDASTFSPNGAIVKVHDGHRTTLGAGILHYPGGVAVDGHGRVYISQWSILPAFPVAGSPFGAAHGEVIRLG
jgi:DNA-binding beta-propeller fold protein YncE